MHRPAAAVALGLALGACGSRPTTTRGVASELVSSNVTRADYAGSKACEPCHAELYNKWATSPMRRMTRRLGDTQIKAPFDGTTIPFHADAVVVEQRDDRRYMRVRSHGKDAAGPEKETLYRVTKVIGGRYREDFVGVEVTGTGAHDPVVGDPSAEPVLPLSWLSFEGSWRYKGYSVMAHERPRLERGSAWRQTCIFCHNTAPLIATLYDDLYGAGAKTYQGSISDDILPTSKRFRFEIADEGALAATLEREIRFVSGKDAASANLPLASRPSTGARPLLAEAISTTKSHFGEQHLVEVGIGCEACHGGAKEHVADPTKKPSYVPTSPVLRAKLEGRAPSHAEAVNRVCARCHTVLFSRYPFTWEGGTRRPSAHAAQAEHAGGSSINSGEARDFLLGHCAGEMACTTCHDPHAEDDKAKLDALATVAGNGVCVKCHAKYGPEPALAAHTHHAPRGEGSACVACHMPKKNAGLAYGLTRYHRIGSPTDAARVEHDRPLECALCHAKKGVSELVETMERWYGKRYDRAALTELYGDDLGKGAIALTLERGRAHEQMTATHVLAEQGSRADAWLLGPLLTSEYPLTRHHAKDAMRRLTGRPVPVDLDAPVDEIRRATARFLVDGGGATGR